MIKPDKCVEWTYYRKEGDILVFAETKEDAIRTITLHGFRIVDEARIQQTGNRILSDVLHHVEADR